MAPARVRVRLSVDQDPVPQVAPHIVRVVEDLVVAVEVAVLDDHRHIVRPVLGPGNGHLFLIVPDGEQSRHAHGHLLGRAHVRDGDGTSTVRPGR